MSETPQDKLESAAAFAQDDVPSDASLDRDPLSGDLVDGSADGYESPGAGSAALASEEGEDDVSPAELTVITGRSPIGAMNGGIATSTELGRLLVGQRLGHFVLEEFIGGGGMGAVFRGTDTLLGRTVAVKVLARQHAEDEETARRFRNEAQSAARLDHENIARVYFVGVDRGWHYLVLEYIDGQNIRDLVDQQGPLPVADVIGFTLQVAEALAHASSRDVVHRDIKPSNVLVTRDKRAKLVDMGLARLHQVEHSSGDITASGVTLGTFDYISPEQARDPRAADVRSDLYSLGCAMYYMLCGRPPFPDGTVLQKLLQHQGDEAPDPRQFRSDLPDELTQILRKLLAKNPEQRYQDPRELIGELLLLCERLGLPTPGGRAAVWISPSAREPRWFEQHLPWLVPVGLLALIVLAVLFFGPHTTDISPPLPNPRKSAGGDGDPKPVVLSAQRAGSNPGARTDDGAGEQRGTKRNQVASAAAVTAKIEKEGNSAANGSAAPLPEAGGTTAGTDTTAASTATGGVDETERRGTGESEAPAAKPISDARLPIVVATAKGERSFASLAEACQQSPSGSVIELRYNGRRDERPIVLTNRELTVRAGEGFRPVVHFRPDGSDPVVYSRSMISVRGGSLTLFNVALELDLPQLVRSDRWSLFETVLAEKVRLERCTLSILNAGDDTAAYHQDVSFFYVKAAPRREAAMMAESPMPDPRVDLEMRDCVVRGEATLLAGTAVHTASLQWENGLLATSERLVSVGGGHTMISAASQLQIDLEHVTAHMRQGMCLMATREDERILPSVRINCTNCILLTDAAPLVQQRGEESIDEQEKLFSWKGNRNLYEGFAVFWRVDGPQAGGPAELDWAAWQSHWGAGREGTERGGSVMFKRLPDRQRNVSSHTPADYALDDDPHNPARGAATDGSTDVGLKADLLPAFSEAAAVTPPPAREAPIAQPKDDLEPKESPKPEKTPPPPAEAGTAEPE